MGKRLVGGWWVEIVNDDDCKALLSMACLILIILNLLYRKKKIKDFSVIHVLFNMTPSL